MSGFSTHFREALEKVIGAVFGDLTLNQFYELLLPGLHTPLVQRRRAALTISRVRMVAAVFAILTPLWIVVDMYIFPWPLWGWLAALRIVASIAFAVIALSFTDNSSMLAAHKALGFLLLIPTLFFMLSHPLLSHMEFEGTASAVATGYAFLPFVMIAGLSVFPITAIEGFLFALPMIGAHIVVANMGSNVFPIGSFLGALWLLLLLMVVATLAAMSQLHFMMALINQASHDGLTGLFTRRVGEELLNLQFDNAMRGNGLLTIAFVDLDKFKEINDKYGHEEGDNALRQAADSMKRQLRRGDVVIRWGGEEFVLIMPNTDGPGAKIAINRLRQSGFGTRPDGTHITASIGISERTYDLCPDWQALVEKADMRMFMAKEAGRNRVCGCDDQISD